MTDRRRIKDVEAVKLLEAQRVSNHRHYAFKCPICSTVQSMASLVAAGADKDKVHELIGFSCEGRLTNAGSWPMPKDQSPEAVERRKIRGCNWTLGGLLQIHTLEVESTGGEGVQPSFEIATPDEAQRLELEMFFDGRKDATLKA